jgi:hypothetical protein
MKRGRLGDRSSFFTLETSFATPFGDRFGDSARFGDRPSSFAQFVRFGDRSSDFEVHSDPTTENEGPTPQFPQIVLGDIVLGDRSSNFTALANEQNEGVTQKPPKPAAPGSEEDEGVIPKDLRAVGDRPSKSPALPKPENEGLTPRSNPMTEIEDLSPELVVGDRSSFFTAPG